MKEFEHGINHDGSFRDRRVGARAFTLSRIYSGLVIMPWTTFFGIILLAYLVLSLIFTLLYLSVDPGNLVGLAPVSGVERFFYLILFSAQVMSTIGSESIVAAGLTNNLIFTIESMTALLYVAVITGLLFVRFSRSTAKLTFSDKMVIGPYKEGKGLMLRLTNAKSTNVIELHAHLFFVMYDPDKNKRNFKQLSLEQEYLPFNPTTWTIVHPIVDGSPFHQVDLDELKKTRFNVIIYVSAVDNVTGQNIFSRQAYAREDIIPNARFSSCTEPGDNGEVVVYLDRIGSYEMIV